MAGGLCELLHTLLRGTAGGSSEMRGRGYSCVVPIARCSAATAQGGSSDTLTWLQQKMRGAFTIAHPNSAEAQPGSPAPQPGSTGAASSVFGNWGWGAASKGQSKLPEEECKQAKEQKPQHPPPPPPPPQQQQWRQVSENEWCGDVGSPALPVSSGGLSGIHVRAEPRVQEDEDVFELGSPDGEDKSGGAWQPHAHAASQQQLQQRWEREREEEQRYLQEQEEQLQRQEQAIRQQQEQLQREQEELQLLQHSTGPEPQQAHQAQHVNSLGWPQQQEEKQPAAPRLEDAGRSAHKSPMFM